jgi:ferrochelatase
MLDIENRGSATQMKTAVLLLAYGTPQNLDDMAAYLTDVREGRKPSPELVEEMKHRYSLIGKSPLNEITAAQAAALEKELARRGKPQRVYVGMRHWEPRIRAAIDQMKADGVEHAVSIVMAPHFSSMSIGKYRKRVEEAQAAAGGGVEFRFVESWWQQPKLVEAVLARVRAGLEKLSGRRTKLIFSAHSLPTRIIQAGDPYDAQLRENAKALAARLPGADWTFAYQSAGASPEPWLGPEVVELLPGLAEQGYQAVLVAAIGFVCDHVEILYDLDIEARAVADKHGLVFARTESLNVDPQFIGAVADAVESVVAVS